MTNLRREDFKMRGVPIDPGFYAILKENGLPSARLADGSYLDPDAQKAWTAWLESRVSP